MCYSYIQFISPTIELSLLVAKNNIPESKIHGVNMRPIWGLQGTGGAHVGPMNFFIWDQTTTYSCLHYSWKAQISNHILTSLFMT